MIIPDFSRETELHGKGYARVAGIDEAGRGPLAGPVAAGAVIFEPDPELVRELLAAGLRDSKLVGERRRERLYELITARAAAWAVAVVDEKVIDKINILEAAKLAMRRAVEQLAVRPDILIIDGNALLRDAPCEQVAVPKADARILTVSAASILAKVTRDRLMDDLDETYPGYGFRRHKGYGTPRHLEALRELGPSPAHRCTFEPIKSMLKGRF